MLGGLFNFPVPHSISSNDGHGIITFFIAVSVLCAFEGPEYYKFVRSIVLVEIKMMHCTLISGRDERLH